MKKWGVCECGKWGEAPSQFKESVHFLGCDCGKPMFLTFEDPREAGHRETQKIIITRLIRHGG